MKSQFLKAKNIILIVLVAIVVLGFSIWEYRQFLVEKDLIQKLEKYLTQGIVKEKAVTPTTTGTIKFLSSEEFSKPIEGMIPLSTTEEKKIFGEFENKVIQLKTSESTMPRIPLLGEEEWLKISDFVPRVVLVCCPLDSQGNLFSCGSGFFVNSSGNILTNYHVTQGMVGTRCLVARTSDFRRPPEEVYSAYLTDRYDSKIDYILLYVERMVYPEKKEITSRSFPYISACNSDIVQIGDPIVVLGYPTYGGNTITATEGIVSGSVENYFKISAKIDSGNSGGPVLLDDPQYKCFIGIATFGRKGTTGYLDYIIKTRSISGFSW
jgi:hypothetical protein